MTLANIHNSILYQKCNVKSHMYGMYACIHVGMHICNVCICMYDDVCMMYVCCMACTYVCMSVCMYNVA